MLLMTLNERYIFLMVLRERITEAGFRVRQCSLVSHVFISTSYLFHVFETPSPLLSSECTRPECQQESWRPECLHPDRKQGQCNSQEDLHHHITVGRKPQQFYQHSQFHLFLCNRSHVSSWSQLRTWSHMQSNYSGAIKRPDVSLLQLNCIKAHV